MVVKGDERMGRIMKEQVKDIGALSPPPPSSPHTHIYIHVYATLLGILVDHIQISRGGVLQVNDSCGGTSSPGTYSDPAF